MAINREFAAVDGKPALMKANEMLEAAGAPPQADQGVKTSPARMSLCFKRSTMRSGATFWK